MRLVPVPVGARWYTRGLGAAVVVATWVLFGCVFAQPRPDVAVHVPVDSIAPHERFTLTLSASVPTHRAVQFPAADAGPSVFGDLRVLSRSPVQMEPVGAGYHAIRSVTYEVTTAVSGSVRVPPLPVRVDAAADTVVTSTLPRTIHVTSRLGGVVSHLREGPLPAPGRSPWTWVVLTGVAIALFGGGTYLWRYIRGADVPAPATGDPTDEAPTPQEVATRRLRALQSRDLTDPDAVESFYVALSDTVRTYLSHRLGVAARERTTREVRAALDRRAEVPPAAVEHVHTVLEQADLVKFAGAQPGPSRTAEVLQAARAAIESVEEATPAETPPADAAASESDPSFR